MDALEIKISIVTYLQATNPSEPSWEGGKVLARYPRERSEEVKEEVKLEVPHGDLVVVKDQEMDGIIPMKKWTIMSTRKSIWLTMSMRNILWSKP
ncbi:hypothetical protein VNO78_09954 [Psophocarpus tetragonolobus]|uniref:Uncharacterized protein n=1 Tax=Psophocarpus tetragonolobus TaxID=3891 RepID=A0AAN9SLE3_PSOTE